MKILVTGNNGSLGRTLTTLFDSKGIKWVGTDGYDLTEPMEVKELFEKNMDISIVVHLAAVQNSDPDVFQKNLAMMENVLRYNKGKARIIFASTNVVYGNICVDRAKINQDTRFGDNKTSELATEKDITIPTSKYGASKLACENLLRIANLTDHIDYTILRFCAIVGPNTRFGAFKDLYEKVKGNKTVRAFGYGPGSTKNFLHVDDAANCVLSAIRNLDKFSEKTFNVAGENAVSIEEMIKIIDGFVNPVGNNIKIEWNRLVSPTDNSLLIISTDHILRSTSWQPQHRTSRSAILAAIQDRYFQEEQGK